MFPLTITPIKNKNDLIRLLRFMEKQSQYYPNYINWVYGKCKDRIESGEYKTLAAFSGQKVIGNIVYKHTNNGDIEIKNFRIDPEYKNRYLGRFLLKQIFNQNKNIILDVSIANFKGVEFFIHNGFKIQNQDNLYLPEQLEYCMIKTAD